MKRNRKRRNPGTAVLRFFIWLLIVALLAALGVFLLGAGKNSGPRPYLPTGTGAPVTAAPTAVVITAEPTVATAVPVVTPEPVIATPEPVATATPVPTASPVPTATPIPTTTPVPDRVPSIADVQAFGAEITYPKEESYLAEYETMYVRLLGVKSTRVYWRAVSRDDYLRNTKFNLYEGDEVLVLARESGMSCVIYTASDGKTHICWVSSGNLAYN